jgi:hypothetical protein
MTDKNQSAALPDNSKSSSLRGGPRRVNDKHHAPGFELDALVDERVFGHTVAWRNKFAWRTDIIDEIKANSRGFDLVTESRIAGAWVPEYSKRIADAWLVVEKVDNRNAVAKEMGVVTCSLTRYDDGYTARFFNSRATAETAPLAICLAALKAVGAVDRELAVDPSRSTPNHPTGTNTDV